MLIFTSIGYIRQPCIYFYPMYFLEKNYRIVQNFDGGNIDKFDEFLSIRQHFPYQNFTLIIFCHLHARPLFRT